MDSAFTPRPSITRTLATTAALGMLVAVAGVVQPVAASAAPLAPAAGVRSAAGTSATSAPDLTDGDLTGDGIPDLVTVGAQNGLPSGLWLAPGTGNGHAAVSPIDIGVNGAGFNSTGSPSDFDGATAITGRFTGGANQDVLIYYPAGIHAGGGVILAGNGNTSPLAAGGNLLMGGSLANLNGDNPTQVANGGNTSGLNTGIPDLLGVLGDSTNGYGLNIYTANVPAGYGLPVTLNVNTPDGTADWNNWTIATTQLPVTGGGATTAMFLWKQSTGELDLWENLQANTTTGALTYTAYPVATRWNTGATLTLQAADINGDGVPDLWTVGANRKVTANLFSHLSTTKAATLAKVTETLN
ncbi:hypothetical protein [Streptacidiphilus fuscans]|uniref:Uncharacterized protein n=1 Tax=Streptacidiphilus fuscans TaxID=2789292 RepID=A0A931B871_9ACTN|nr:hypothetical protein [Streptacidiphilus fuscans]MBF9070816.1 hypothetical protein [Streptacidiphilus fuscans]